MPKGIRKLMLGLVSILGISAIIWTIILLNPSLSYAHEVQIGQVSVHYNSTLPGEAESIILDAIEIIKTSDLYIPDMAIDLCLNDGSSYPDRHPKAGGLAYSFLNKTVLYFSTPNFANNTSEYQWATNNEEIRQVNLTWLLAHEFAHTLQWNNSIRRTVYSDFWKTEGYAEYISRQYPHDGLLHEKIERLLEEQKKEHIGIPIIILPDSTNQSLDYYKYGLMMQYIIEVEASTYIDICKDKRTEKEVYDAMVAWTDSSR